MTVIPPHYVRDTQGNYHHPSRLVGGLLPAKPQQDPLPALVKEPKARARIQKRVALCITLIRVGKAMLDDDNLASCFKGTRDAIAKSLGVDDRDSRVKWEYGQISSGRGRVGCIVKIERL